jgi:hypothetical protein
MGGTSGFKADIGLARAHFQGRKAAGQKVTAS